jgi:mono/diheme cytochrome c family protein
MKSIVFGMTCVAFAGMAYATAAAQGPTKVSEGAYTADQAKRGEPVYKEQCAACHGDKLEGSGPMPALSGVDFVKNWGGKPVADLFDKTQQTMPATAPGSLTGPQTADILAYMFSVSAYPTGASELPSTTEALKSIEFDVKQ